MVSDADEEQETVHWSHFERSRIDSRAPSPVSRTRHVLYLHLGRLIYYALLPCVAIIWLGQFFLDPRHKTLPLRDFLWARTAQLWSPLTGWYIPSLADEASRRSITPPHVAEEFVEEQRRGAITIETIKLEPVRKQLRRGIGAAAWVKETVVPGFWVTPKGSVGIGDSKAEPGEKVILHLHGGGYVGGHPLWMSMTLRVVQRVKSRLLGVNYRKPVSTDASFPTPLLDALSGYIHLTEDLGFAPESIAFFGKSAGGHLCLMLSRYLRDLGLAQPGRIVMLAPWCDFTLSSPSYKRNKTFDIIGRTGLQTAVRASMRWYKPEALENSYFSPAKAKPDEWTYLKEAGTKVYLLAGTRELFYDEIVAVYKTMKEAGVDVRLREDPGGLHTSVMWTDGPGEVFLKDVGEVMGL